MVAYSVTDAWVYNTLTISIAYGVFAALADHCMVYESVGVSLSIYATIGAVKIITGSVLCYCFEARILWSKNPVHAG